MILPHRGRGHEIELVPERIQLASARLVEHQLIERRIVAEVALHQVEPGRQQPPRWAALRVEVRRAIGHDERVGERGAEPLQLGRVGGVLISRIPHPMRGQLAVPPEHERLAPLRDPAGLNLGHARRVGLAQADDRVAHLLALATGLGGLRSDGRQRLPHRPQLDDRPGLRSDGGSGQDRLDRGQVLRAQAGLAGEVVQGGLRLAQLGAMTVPPGREEVVGVIHLVPAVEVDDPPDAILVAVGVGDGGMGAKANPPGISTRWSATSRAAARYFLSRAGDIASDSPELSNPASFAGSTGNSRGRPDVDARQVADRVIVFRVAEPARQDRTRITRIPPSLAALQRPDPLDDRAAARPLRASASPPRAASPPRPAAPTPAPRPGGPAPPPRPMDSRSGPASPPSSARRGNPGSIGSGTASRRPRSDPPANVRAVRRARRDRHQAGQHDHHSRKASRTHQVHLQSTGLDSS